MSAPTNATPEIFEHPCMLTSARSSTDCSGKIVLELMLENIRGWFPTTVSAENFKVDLQRLPLSVMVLSTSSINFHYPSEVQEVRTLAVDGRMNAATLLPQHLCPAVAHDALDSVALLAGGLQTPSVKAFINRVLLDPAVRVPFVQMPGSRRHHHASPGGLVRHAAECGRIASAMCDAAGVTNMPRDVTVVAAIIHDIGKIRTNGPLHNWRNDDHRQQTLDLIRPHLDQLTIDDFEAGTSLRYILQWMARPAGTQAWPQLIGADVVVAADRTSVALTQAKPIGELLPILQPGSARFPRAA